ncbi:hypothetical protein MLD38_009264 [Melastoma candidum]|uniref:Uncharacterized protein n=2 Tax=Melastoma candidum TaxID=119954 RepID=A0ACB9RNT5_9MYRT|nr:hypothetical protein MLD38_006723 [Melastoma candidum]KAI4383426.1 hypothetical protein MLD38_009264 [Melastoma candidum]
MSGYKSLALASHALLVLSFFVRASVAATSGSCTCSPYLTITIVLYIQAVRYNGTNTNYTTYSVAEIQGTNFGARQFGTINVYDDPMTFDASPTLTSVGRLQGIYAVADMNGPTRLITATIQFTGGQYANSSLNIKGLGTAIAGVPVRLAIDGGTNVFNNAKGDVTFVKISRSGPNSVFQAISTPQKPSKASPSSIWL